MPSTTKKSPTKAKATKTKATKTKATKTSPRKPAKGATRRPAAIAAEETRPTSEPDLPETFDTDEEPRGRRQHGAAHPLDPIDDETPVGDETVDVESGIVGGHGGDPSP